MTPVRLQLSRARGFRLQELSLATNGLPAVKVDRTTRWGNPFRVAEGVNDCRGKWLVCFNSRAWVYDTRDEATHGAVALFEAWLRAGRLDISVDDVREVFSKSNAACWCSTKPGTPCHAQILLEIANPKETQPQ